MKKVFRKVVPIIMAAALSLSFTACMKNLDSNNAQEIIDLLNRKYGTEFDVKSIGNRLASDKADTVTAYCYPKNNEKVVFEAVMNVERELVSDDYPVRLLEVEAKEIIEKKFSEGGIKATVAVSIARISDEEKLIGSELDKLIAENPEMSLTFTTVLSEDADTRGTYDVIVALLEGFYSGNPRMSVGTTIWKFSNSTYIDCANEMNGIPDISKTVLEQYGPLSKANVAIVDGLLNTDYEEFEKKF